MNTKTFFLAMVLLAMATAGRAAPEPAVESRAAFIKIVAGAPSVDTPAELNPPLLLYLRKSSLLRVAMTFSARSVTYEVAITVWGPDYAPRNAAASAPSTDAVRVFTYRFAKEASAASFCEALIANQDG